MTPGVRDLRAAFYGQPVFLFIEKSILLLDEHGVLNNFAEVNMINYDRRKESGKKEPEKICGQWMEEITAIYVFLIFVIYPFYYQDKYFNIGDAKWSFFWFLSCGTGILLAALSFYYLIGKIRKRQLKKDKWNIQFSVTDSFVVFYIIVVILSVILSPYKSQVIWGHSGWYMGLMAQVCFALIYCFVSRLWKWDRLAVICYLAAAFFVFLLAVFMRFGVDPLKLYDGLGASQVIEFVSTIGQATWYSSYVAVIFPLGMFAFWFYENRYVRIFSGVFTAVGFMTIVTQNSDSMFAALIMLFLALFWLSVESNKRLCRFLEVVILCLASFKFIGICQMLFPEKAVRLDVLSQFCSQSRITWILLAIAICFYLAFGRMERRGYVDISRIKNIRIALLAVAAIAVFATVIYIGLNTTGQLPKQLQSSNNYLMFDEAWGHDRGFSWKIAVKSFWSGNISRKLLGCGPDGFSLYAQSIAEDNQQRERIAMFACAHNEWLNTLVNLGVIGVTAYLGIFVSAIYRFSKNADKHPELTGIMLTVISYMTHNFFCYQQFICTPMAFILIGAGEAIIAQGKKK